MIMPIILAKPTTSVNLTSECRAYPKRFFFKKRPEMMSKLPYAVAREVPGNVVPPRCHRAVQRWQEVGPTCLATFGQWGMGQWVVSLVLPIHAWSHPCMGQWVVSLRRCSSTMHHQSARSQTKNTPKQQHNSTAQHSNTTTTQQHRSRSQTKNTPKHQQTTTSVAHGGTRPGQHSTPLIVLCTK